MPAVHHVWQRLGTSHGRCRRINTTLTALLAIVNTLGENSAELILPAEAVDRLMRSTDEFLLGYQRLAHDAESCGKLLWNNPTKFHWLWHLSRKARFLNPRRTNTFIDEDFVGKMKGLVHSCAAGTELHGMLGKTAEKYRWGLHFLAEDCRAGP